jgi:hypothetical protein
MGSSMSLIDTVDQRSTLYYNKYRYRARLHLLGLNRTWYTKTITDFVQKIEQLKNDVVHMWNKPYYSLTTTSDITNIDIDAIERYLSWRNIYFTPINKSDKKVLVRIEHNVASVFSNDLSILQLLESVDGPGSVSYTEVDTCIPTGIKYFKNEPKHKYRSYLKTKYNIEDKFREDLIKFFDRYKNTNTVVVPSLALRRWLKPDSRKWNRWQNRHCSSHFFIDYDDDSTNTLIGIMFGDMISKRFTLQKEPDPK